MAQLFGQTGPENASDEDAKEINFRLNPALTNITQSDVICHHSGGVFLFTQTRKDRWGAWCAKNARSFKVSTEVGNRNHPNYPN